MRWNDPRGPAVLGALAVVAALTGVGTPRAWAGGNKATAKVDETVADLASVSRGTDIHVMGVGLVIGLDGTGSAPSPSAERQRLLDEMRKARVLQADKILDSPDTSLVVVKGRIPSGISTHDRLDVEVELPPGSTTTSLKGGWLIETRLTEVGIAGGQMREGQFLATAGGPLMIGTGDDPKIVKSGRVLGGCRVRNDVPYLLLIKENRQSGKTAALLQMVINRRFHQHEGNDEKGMVNAKSDKHLVLKIPHAYHHNQFRYFQVVHLLPIIDEPNLRAQRLDRWSKELLDPATAGISALRLEGIGKNASGILKTGLESPNAQVRFFSAEALAYLDDPAGVDVLAHAVTNLPEFRAFGLAALSAMSEPAAGLRLRALMNEPDLAVRYGAFNALRVRDEFDPFLGRVRVLRDPPAPEVDEENPQAITLAAIRRRQDRPDDPFSLYVVDCDGPPMIHATRDGRCEVVLFGRHQRLLTPAVLGNGDVLLNASDGDRTVQITRIEPQRANAQEWRITAPLELVEVVREVANLGASYPEVLEILQAAERQKNLPGPLVFDSAPVPNRAYDEAQLTGRDATAKKDDELHTTAAAAPQRRSRFQRFRFWDRNSDRAPEAREPEEAEPTVAPKKDEAVGRASFTASRPERTSLLDRLFGSKRASATSSPRP